MGCVLFYIGFVGVGSASCESQSKIKDFCQLPLAREPFLPGIGAKSHLAKGAFGCGIDTWGILGKRE